MLQLQSRPWCSREEKVVMVVGLGKRRWCEEREP